MTVSERYRVVEGRPNGCVCGSPRHSSSRRRKKSSIVCSYTAVPSLTAYAIVGTQLVQVIAMVVRGGEGPRPMKIRTPAHQMGPTCERQLKHAFPPPMTKDML